MTEVFYDLQSYSIYYLILHSLLTFHQHERETRESQSIVRSIYNVLSVRQEQRSQVKMITKILSCAWYWVRVIGKVLA